MAVSQGLLARLVLRVWEEVVYGFELLFELVFLWGGGIVWEVVVAIGFVEDGESYLLVYRVMKIGDSS